MKLSLLFLALWLVSGCSSEDKFEPPFPVIDSGYWAEDICPMRFNGWMTRECFLLGKKLTPVWTSRVCTSGISGVRSGPIVKEPVACVFEVTLPGTPTILRQATSIPFIKGSLAKSCHTSDSATQTTLIAGPCQRIPAVTSAKPGSYCSTDTAISMSENSPRSTSYRQSGITRAKPASRSRCHSTAGRSFSKAPTTTHSKTPIFCTVRMTTKINWSAAKT